MEKLDNLFGVEFGEYATPKKLNRSGAKISQSIIDQIEAGAVTSEVLKDIGKLAPVYKYKTCITIHGHFDLEDVPKIGGYKNVIQNKNGSLELRYSAFDVEKKKRLAKMAQVVSDWRFYYDSRGAMFQIMRPYTTSEQFEAIKADLRATAGRMAKDAECFGKTWAYTANVWGTRYIVLEFSLLAIFEDQIDRMAEAMTGKGIAEIRAAVDQMEKEVAEKQRLADIDREKRQAIQAEREQARLELDKEIRSFPAYGFEVGSIGIKAGLYKNAVPCFRLVRVTAKGRFNRVKFETAIVKTLAEIPAAQYLPVDRECPKGDIRLQGLRQFS